MNRRSVVLVAAVCLMAPGWLAADVLDSAAGGFTVKEVVRIQATPQDVYSKFFRVGDWWSPVHTYSHDAHNLTIEEKAGGCWCEKLPAGGSVKHMEVVSLMPGSVIVLHGAMGPLQAMATTGSMQVKLAAADGGGTSMEVTYAVAGYLPQGLTTWAPIIDGVMKEQFTRLKNLIEKGDPAAK